ncbi:MAG: DUF2752 domain-containing protein [Bacteroidetes bacterium]|nr:DUF2752 domain-containing protein [Bacteroidota bacterium]
MIRFIRILFQKLYQHLELLFWVTSLLVLFFLPVQKTESSLCLFSLLGGGPCPGCGLGHAIYYALHLHPVQSFQHHPIGIFAVLVIFMRIRQLIHFKTNNHETQPNEHDRFH